MNVLVTGGAGYIGSTLVPRLLAGGHSVRVLDSLLHGGESLLAVWGHSSFQFQTGDIRSRKDRQAALDGVQAVVHLAAIVGDPACARQSEVASAVNLEASLALFEEAGRAGVSRCVFASTCSNYGRMADPESYVDEESVLAPVSHYAETKVAVERWLLEGDYNGMCATPLRFATVYGVSPRMRFDLTVNEFTMELITAGHLVIFGEQFWRPYIHVADAARAIELVLQAPAARVQRRVFNVGNTAENYRKGDLVELIRGHADLATVEYVERLEDPRDYRVCFTRMRTELGFETTHTVQDGIDEVARLVRSRAIPDPHAARYRN
jgi:nucleoside-diphosphate-sugar epimerase